MTIERNYVKNLSLDETIVTDINDLIITGDYLPLSGGVISGELSVEGNVAIDDKLLVRNKTLKQHQVLNGEYTAFEVFPTDYNIASGQQSDVKSIFSTDENEILLNYEENVASCDTLTFGLLMTKLQTDCNIIVDFGDGIIIDVSTTPISSSAEPTDIERYDNEESNNWVTFNQCVLNITHRYAIPNKKYIVKIYGSNYIRLRGYHGKNQNIISRIFDRDLPVASCLLNVSSICADANKCLKLEVPDYFDPKNIMNIAGFFCRCKNLQEVRVYSNSTLLTRNNYISYENIFQKCNNLKYCDFRIPELNNNYNQATGMYEDCSRLSGDILDLLPQKITTLNNCKFYMNNAFYNCECLSCSDFELLGNILWNNKDVFEIHDKVFTGCTLMVDNCPESWGGNIQPAKIYNYNDSYIEVKLDYSSLVSEENQMVLQDIIFNNAILSENYQMSVDWGDGTIETKTTLAKNALTHCYQIIYNISTKFTVKIYGLNNFCSFFIGKTNANGTGRTDGRIDYPGSYVTGLTLSGNIDVYTSSSGFNITNTNAEYIDLSKSHITVIKNSGFSTNKQMKSIKLPNTLTEIGTNGINLAYELTNITIPSSVTSMLTGCFSRASKLKTLVFNEKTEEEIKSMENYGKWGLNSSSTEVKIYWNKTVNNEKTAG